MGRTVSHISNRSNRTESEFIMTLQDRFQRAIRTTQSEGGGFYIEAVLAVNGEVNTYGQHYSPNEDSPTYAENLNVAVERFKKFYFPLYVQDMEAN